MGQLLVSLPQSPSLPTASLTLRPDVAATDCGVKLWHFLHLAVWLIYIPSPVLPAELFSPVSIQGVCPFSSQACGFRRSFRSQRWGLHFRHSGLFSTKRSSWDLWNPVLGLSAQGSFQLCELFGSFYPLFNWGLLFDIVRWPRGRAQKSAEWHSNKWLKLPKMPFSLVQNPPRSVLKGISETMHRTSSLLMLRKCAVGPATIFFLLYLLLLDLGIPFLQFL